MNSWNVLFCYFDRKQDIVHEVCGHVDFFGQRNFINELYSMKLDANYSTNQFFHSGFFTGDLVSLLYPENGVVDFSRVFSILCDSGVNDSRLCKIVQSFFEKIDVDDIQSFSVLGDTLIGDSIFEDSFFSNVKTSGLVANTWAFEVSGYDFYQVLQEQKMVDFKRPKVLFDVG